MTMHRLALALGLALVVSLACVAEETNLARGLTYTWCPNPTYPHCTDEGDATQLTDGVTQYTAGNIWMLTSCVGWYAGESAPVVILFDLGREATLSELRFNTTGGGGAEVQDVGLRVFVSLDDCDYVFAAEFPTPPAIPAEETTIRGVQRRVALADARARYVAVSAAPPPRHNYVFVDEIEIMGRTPADPASGLPVQPSIEASGAEGLREVLSGGRQAARLLLSLTAPVYRHIGNWPAELAGAQREDLDTFVNGVVRSQDYPEIRASFTERHRRRALAAYGKKVLLWEVPPDEAFTNLTMPEDLAPPKRATIHTVVNALEATALGVANLAEGSLSLHVDVSGNGGGAPFVTPRVARFFATADGVIVPDALLARDCPQVIPPGDSRLVWLGAESTDAVPGVYRYEVRLTAGGAVHVVPLEVRVHDVTLSKETPLCTGNWSYLDDPDAPVYTEVRDSMLAHRITNAFGTSNACPFPKRDENGDVVRPVQLDFTAMDRFLDFHKDFDQVSWFLSFNPHTERPQGVSRYGKSDWMSDEFKEIFREWLTGIVAHIRERGRDYDAFYFQMFDERLNEKVADGCRLVHSIDPKVRVMITFYSDASAAAVESFVNESGMDIYVHHATRLGYDNAPDGYPMLSSQGRELWFYGAADIRRGDGRERDPLDFFRLMHWLAFRHNATGVHFWNMLKNATSGWKDAGLGEIYWPFVYPIGEGYPPPPDDVKTAETVIPSRRWEYTRMGIEDYMLLSMAREKIDALGDAGAAHQKQLDDIVSIVLTDFADNRRLFRAKRRELVELVERLYR